MFKKIHQQISPWGFISQADLHSQTGMFVLQTVSWSIAGFCFSCTLASRLCVFLGHQTVQPLAVIMSEWSVTHTWMSTNSRAQSEGGRGASVCPIFRRTSSCEIFFYATREEHISQKKEKKKSVQRTKMDKKTAK